MFAALLLVGATSSIPNAAAQVAGSTTTIGISVAELTQVATGWSVKKTLLGKSVYNDAGDKVGTVQDLIISPDRNVSYLIIGAGGFIGIGRHDVAIPVGQIQDKAGKLVMAGATKDIVKAMPRFDYATDTDRRDQLVASTEQDIAKAKAKIDELERKSGAAAADAKGKLDQQVLGIRKELKITEDKLGELKRAAANRWHDFEADLGAATARLRKAL
jgi:sporulation protein YlmC with PRC-barrel domain